MTKLLVLTSHFGAMAHDYGPFYTLATFFIIMPLGHMTIGVLFVVAGLAYPKISAVAENQKLKLGANKVNIEVEGSHRTILFGIGAFIIAASFVEAAVT